MNRAIDDDLLAAKRILSKRFLRSREGELSLGFENRVAKVLALESRNIHAVGVGRKRVEGQDDEAMCVRVYVSRKLPESFLAPILRVPKFVEGIPTDVVESQPAFFSTASAKQALTCSDERKERIRPVVAGISVGHYSVTAGSVAYFCRDLLSEDDREVYILSNSHIFSDVNGGAVGDDIYQPGVIDGGGMEDRLAVLERAIPIRNGPDGINRVDAAIARLETGYKLEICSIGKISGTVQATEGLEVRKHGRTTGYTEGYVYDESYDVLVWLNCQEYALFEDQIRIHPKSSFQNFGEPGDSGSLVVTQYGLSAVGLYFAGDVAENYSLANPIGDVLSELNVQLL